jgi:hypothetical protein
MAITSPDERTYCLNVGDTIAIELQFADPQPNKVWCRVVDSSHCPPGFFKNPYQAPKATELAESPTGSGTYPGTHYTVTNNNHHDAHVLFWWIWPNDTVIQFDKRDFSIAAPGSNSCSGISVAFKKRRRDNRPESKKAGQKQMAKKKQKARKKSRGAKA